MKNETISGAVIPGVIAAAALVLSFTLPVSVDRLVGFGTVIAVLGIATLEYRIDWKRIFGRLPRLGRG